MRTEIVVCAACGGPAPRSGGVCPWCGAGLVARPAAGAGGDRAGAPSARRTFCPHCARLYADDEAACPRCTPPDAPATVEPFWGANAAREPRGRACPACAGALAPERLGAVTVDRCGSCAGVWFDVGEVARVVDLSTWGATAAPLEDLEREARRRAPPRDARGALACVRCGARTFRRLVAPRGPAYVDICVRHGLWFDRGEFDAFRAFVAAGGLEIARRREGTPVRRTRKFPLLADDRPASAAGILAHLFLSRSS